MNTPAVCIRGRQTRLAIALLALNGMTFKQIAPLLGIAPRTVAFHWASIKASMGGSLYEVANRVVSVRQEEWGL